MEAKKTFNILFGVLIFLVVVSVSCVIYVDSVKSDSNYLFDHVNELFSKDKEKD